MGRNILYYSDDAFVAGELDFDKTGISIISVDSSAAPNAPNAGGGARTTIPYTSICSIRAGAGNHMHDGLSLMLHSGETLELDCRDYHPAACLNAIQRRMAEAGVPVRTDAPDPAYAPMRESTPLPRQDALAQSKHQTEAHADQTPFPWRVIILLALIAVILRLLVKALT